MFIVYWYPVITYFYKLVDNHRYQWYNEAIGSEGHKNGKLYREQY